MAGAHASPRRCPCGAPRGMEAGVWRAHRSVGPGESIGAVTQRCYRGLPFILVVFLFLFRVGLCSAESLFCAGHVAALWASAVIAGHSSRGLGSTRSSIKHVRVKGLSEQD